MVNPILNKDGIVTGIIVTCECCCGCIEFKLYDEDITISYYGAEWYSAQGLRPITNSINALKSKLKGEPYISAGCILSAEEMEDFINYAKMICIENDTEKEENNSHLSLEYISIENTYIKGCYDFQIRLDMSMLDIIRGKLYRSYEIVMNKQEWDFFILKLNKFIEHLKNKYNR